MTGLRNLKRLWLTQRWVGKVFGVEKEAHGLASVVVGSDESITFIGVQEEKKEYPSFYAGCSPNGDPTHKIRSGGAATGRLEAPSNVDGRQSAPGEKTLQDPKHDGLVLLRQLIPCANDGQLRGILDDVAEAWVAACGRVGRRL